MTIELFNPGSGGGGGGGDVTGPASSTDNAFVRFDGPTGKIIKNSVVLGDNSGNVTGANSFKLADNKQAIFGTGDDAILAYDTAQTPDSLFLGAGADSKIMVFGLKADFGTDFLGGLARTYPTLRIVSEAANPDAFLDILHTGTSGANFSSSEGGMSFDDTTNVSGDVNPSFSFFPGDRSGLTPSLVNQYHSFVIDASGMTKSWTAGVQGIQAENAIYPPTYEGTAPGSTVFGALTFGVLGLPVQGANMTIGTAITFAAGDPTGAYKSSSATAFSIGSFIPGIDNGIGDVSSRIGFSISGPVDGSPMSLGNQTAALSQFCGIAIETVDFESTTNTRTIETVASIKSRAWTAGSNVSVTNGPYAFYAESDISEEAPSRLEGRLLSSKKAVTAAANIICTRPFNEISGNTQIDTISPPLNNLSTIIVLHFLGTPTVKNNTAGSGASIQLAGGVDFGATAGDTLTLCFDGTNWREIARAVI